MGLTLISLLTPSLVRADAYPDLLGPIDAELTSCMATNNDTRGMVLCEEHAWEAYWTASKSLIDIMRRQFTESARNDLNEQLTAWGRFEEADARLWRGEWSKDAGTRWHVLLSAEFAERARYLLSDLQQLREAYPANLR